MSFCCTTLSITIETPTKWRGRCSRMAELSSTASDAMVVCHPRKPTAAMFLLACGGPKVPRGSARGGCVRPQVGAGSAGGVHGLTAAVPIDNSYYSCKLTRVRLHVAHLSALHVFRELVARSDRVVVVLQGAHNPR